MKSTVVKRSIVVAGHKTSVSLEDAFWNGLKEIVRERRMTLSELVAEIDAQRQLGNLSSAPTFPRKGRARRNSRHDWLHCACFLGNSDKVNAALFDDARAD